MKGLVLGIALSVGLAGVAQAADFLVVSSTDPAIKTGEEFKAGAHVPVGAGKKVVVMRPSGEVTVLKGTPGGANLPGMTGAQADASRFDAIKTLMQPPPQGLAFGARRGFCPPVESLITIDQIVKAGQHGCNAKAREALSVYIKRAGQEPAEQPVQAANPG